MTYDWGWVGGPPFPIAPINEVKKVLDYMALRFNTILFINRPFSDIKTVLGLNMRFGLKMPAWLVLNDIFHARR